MIEKWGVRNRCEIVTFDCFVMTSLLSKCEHIYIFALTFL